MNAAEEWRELFEEWGNDAEGQPLPLSVQTKSGSGQLGPTFAAPYSIPGLPQMPQTRTIRTSNGNEAVSQTAVYAPKEHAGRFTLGSRVTLADGRVSTVLGIQSPDILGLFAFVRVDLE